MTSERDRDLVERIRAGAASGIALADDPAAVAGAVAGDPGVVRVDVTDLAPTVVAARVRIAEVLVERAREAEGRLAADLARTSDTRALHGADHRDADRQAVRFALVILLLALPAGIAVYVVDGLLLAPALPAVALAGLGAVVFAHRQPTAPGQLAAAAAEDEAPAVDPPGIDDAPAVRAAEAHLRRQQAAWKVHWWERDDPAPDLAAWSPQVLTAGPLTVVVVDAGGAVDEGSHATATATAPAAVRVVVLRAG